MQITCAVPYSDIRACLVAINMHVPVAIGASIRDTVATSSQQPLACIAHKSLEICAPKAFGANSGILLLRRRIPLLFSEKDSKTVCFDPFLLSQAL